MQINTFISLELPKKSTQFDEIAHLLPVSIGIKNVQTELTINSIMSDSPKGIVFHEN